MHWKSWAKLQVELCLTFNLLKKLDSVPLSAEDSAVSALPADLLGPAIDCGAEIVRAK
jgi:hypothetical protein